MIMAYKSLENYFSGIPNNVENVRSYPRPKSLYIADRMFEDKKVHVMAKWMHLSIFPWLCRDSIYALERDFKLDIILTWAKYW
jgi:hypothetical protein